MDEEKNKLPLHFKGKEAVEHVIEHQVEGILASAEIHGAEVPGHLSAAADSARETAIVLLLVSLLLMHSVLSFWQIFVYLSLFSLGWLLWKVGRSAWLGWTRLERLHRAAEEERWEIEHHRDQEREELAALYRAKGLEGKLLEDVLDVLMSDGDRLLRVMLEEELGLSLENQEHPLKQSLGAAIGVLMTSFICLSLYLIGQEYGLLIGSFAILGSAGALSAYYEKNQMISAIVWNVGIGFLAYASVYFLMKYYASH